MIEQIYLFFVGFFTNEFVQFMLISLVPFIALGLIVPRMLDHELKKDKEKKLSNL